MNRRGWGRWGEGKEANRKTEGWLSVGSQRERERERGKGGRSGGRERKTGG